ncbi:DUF2653 family protein (plasmid) [Bacillus velezensis]|uniref:DUF2653 family protein n=1 Tax=Bacillus velezensis TaxID=492670 RepID=UPI00049EF3DA|nr:DUF2653 family protein [Bacillus velezensis]KDN91271.1 hypothetical protein EF87_19755 [Bacillus amyloliquefaciens]QRV11369.1 DUF2653 family protein [Bacillus velezensis]URJ76364.1 DUF2653 family protein [Bacillus velezensis]URJ80484.1 DUF2653 family protein [Bacillus velezensis]
MKLLLNEQEVRDGICVAMADHYGVEPEDIEKVELEYIKGLGVQATASFDFEKERYKEVDIIKGIETFLEEYHLFDTETMKIELRYHKKDGVFAEVFVNE